MEKPRRSYSIREFNNDDSVSSLVDIISILGRGWRYVVLFTLIASAIGFFYGKSLPKEYKSEALLFPVISEDESGLASLAGQFGGVASLAGIDLSSVNNNDKSKLAIEILQSRLFITSFIEKYSLEVPIYGTTGWDHSKNKWIIDDKKYDVANKSWVVSNGFWDVTAPTKNKLYEYFTKSMLKIRVNKDTGFIKLALYSKSAQHSKEWLSNLIVDINQYMKDMDIKGAKNSIKYLQQSLEKTSIAEMKMVLHSLIEQQTRILMLAETKSEYVFKVVDPPYFADKATKPKVALITVIASVIGFFIGASLVLLRHNPELRP